MKIYVKGNFLVYIDSNNIVWTENLESVLMTKNTTSSTDYNLLFKSTNTKFTDLAFSSINDEAGSPYASQSVFETYIYENTGIRFQQPLIELDDLNDVTISTPSNGQSLVYNSTTSKWENNLGSYSSNLLFVVTKADLPTPSGGVITLESNKTYFITATIDLTGDRLVCGANTTIIGGSSENCVIKSTGLNSSTALITSVYSLPIRNITITHGTAVNLDGDATTTALDWFGVNFTDCATIGTIKDYTNFIMQDSAFLNSGGMTLDGTIGTIGFTQCLFDLATTTTGITIAATCNVTRRFRIIYSSFVTSSGETSINVSSSATIGNERYILDTVNFAGGGTYITGVDQTSNKSLFINCVGIDNTAVNGQMYMHGNATATIVGATNTFYKALGTTTASSDNSKYTHTNNRLTNDATISRKYLLQCSLSFTSGNGDVCEFGFYDSKLGAVRTPSKTKATANASGRAENVHLACVVLHSQNDYIELHVANTSSAVNITITDMNLVITEIK